MGSDVASKQFPVLPIAGVYRSADRQCFLLMHFAQVNPGHYVGWGQLDEYTREDFTANGRTYVVKSLKEFSSRNGKNPRKRLKLPGGQPLHQVYDLVRVRAIAPRKLELIPYRRGACQHERLEGRNTVLILDISPEAFFAELESAFARGAS